MAAIDIHINGESMKLPGWVKPVGIVALIIIVLIVANMLRSPSSTTMTDQQQGAAAYDKSAEKVWIDEAQSWYQVAEVIKGKAVFDYSVEFNSPTSADVKVYYRDTDNTKHYAEITLTKLDDGSFMRNYKGVKDAQ